MKHIAWIYALAAVAIAGAAYATNVTVTTPTGTGKVLTWTDTAGTATADTGVTPVAMVAGAYQLGPEIDVYSDTPATPGFVYTGQSSAYNASGYNRNIGAFIARGKDSDGALRNVGGIFGYVETQTAGSWKGSTKVMGYQGSTGEIDGWFSPSGNQIGAGLTSAGFRGAGTTAFSGVVYPVQKTVSTLPTCNSAALGAVGVVTDSNTTTFNATAAGSGSNVMLVLCDGSNWKVH